MKDRKVLKGMKRLNYKDKGKFPRKRGQNLRKLGIHDPRFDPIPSVLCSGRVYSVKANPKRR